MAAGPPTGATFAEKLPARAAGLPSTRAGEIVDAYPDLVMSHAASWRCIRVLEQPGTDRLHDPDRIAMVMDHDAPAYTAKTAADQKLCREFAVAHGIRKFYDVGAGIAHIVLSEAGHVRPGMLLIGTDSHSTIYGAPGAAGTGVGFSEVAATWLTGYLSQHSGLGPTGTDTGQLPGAGFHVAVDATGAPAAIEAASAALRRGAR